MLNPSRERFLPHALGAVCGIRRLAGLDPPCFRHRRDHQGDVGVRHAAHHHVPAFDVSRCTDGGGVERLADVVRQYLASQPRRFAGNHSAPFLAPSPDARHRHLDRGHVGGCARSRVAAGDPRGHRRRVLHEQLPSPANAAAGAVRAPGGHSDRFRRRDHRRSPRRSTDPR